MCLRLTMFLYSSRASSSVVSAPIFLSMTSPYWFRHRYVDMASLDLDGCRKSSLLVNSLFSAPGKRTLLAISYMLHPSAHHALLHILLSVGGRSNTSALPRRCSHCGLSTAGQSSESLRPQPARRVAEGHFVLHMLHGRGADVGFGRCGNGQVVGCGGLSRNTALRLKIPRSQDRAAAGQSDRGPPPRIQGRGEDGHVRARRRRRRLPRNWCWWLVLARIVEEKSRQDNRTAPPRHGHADITGSHRAPAAQGAGKSRVRAG